MQRRKMDETYRLTLASVLEKAKIGTQFGYGSGFTWSVSTETGQILTLPAGAVYPELRDDNLSDTTLVFTTPQDAHNMLRHLRTLYPSPWEGVS